MPKLRGLYALPLAERQGSHYRRSTAAETDTHP
jgi:hypothetical protein